MSEGPRRPPGDFGRAPWIRPKPGCLHLPVAHQVPPEALRATRSPSKACRLPAPIVACHRLLPHRSVLLPFQGRWGESRRLATRWVKKQGPASGLSSVLCPSCLPSGSSCDIQLGQSHFCLSPGWKRASHFSPPSPAGCPVCNLSLLHLMHLRQNKPPRARSFNSLYLQELKKFQSYAPSPELAVETGEETDQEALLQNGESCIPLANSYGVVFFPFISNRGISAGRRVGAFAPGTT